MKLIKTLGLVIVLLVILAVVAGLFMDPQWRVERRTTVAAPAAEVYGFISRIPNWVKWTAWNPETYPGMQIAYSGPESGVGARQSWNDGAMTGYVEITAEEPGKHFDYLVSMDEGKHQMSCRLAVAAVEGGSKVNWSCSGEVGGNPLDRLMMAAYRPMMGKDFEKGLGNLQQRYAAEPKP